MKRSDVLVIGGLGFIGSNLMEGHSNWDVIDLANGEDVRQGIQKDRYRVVVLLAADLKHTRAAYEWNLDIYRAVVEYLLDQTRQPHIIYTSSAAVYESLPSGRNLETDVPKPATIYGLSKLLGEDIFKAIASSYTILRLSNVAGTGEGNGAVDRFIRGGRKIYGDGGQVRDYVSVNKVVKAIEKIVERPRDFKNQTYNISTGKGQTVNEVFAKYSSRTPVYRPERAFDVPYSVLDNAKATEAGLL